MSKILRRFLISSRKRRRFAATLALWLIRLITDAESVVLERNSGLLDTLDYDDMVSRCKYIAVEEDYSYCEFILGFLDCAVTDIGDAYF
jgi:hypothetical protein